ncbi:TMEM175 family protein [Actinosynnema sp. CS-041913]|uniref:TMEM175 family protein n=1 Tax=Actinosynnema sp. CS-041913 TaxID=3239917 RepID=UPI003D93EBB6
MPNPTPHDRSDQPIMSASRLELFSDAVFAISITLLALEIRPPEPSEHLGADLLGLWPQFAALVISFLLIGQVWLNHHAMFTYIKRVDRVLMVLNLLLLLNVAFLPFSTAVLAEAISTGAGDRAAAVFYGLSLAVGGVFFNAIWAYASAGHRLLGADITPAQAAVMRRRFAVGPLLYLVAALVGLVSAVASLALYAFLLVLYLAEIAAPRGDR